MSDQIQRLNAALDGRYRIERDLGEGGMATVYLADDVRHERKVALKVLKPELAAVVGADRFLAEITTTASLKHPHILPLFDSGQADGFLFYVMPYVEGESLRAKLRREGQLRVEEAVAIASDVAGALDYAHRQGVIHRDVKPGNILLLEGRAVVADFGIALAVGSAGAARLTESAVSLGTPQYMSPEQATGDAVIGPATDIYALGCVTYETLVGEPPFTGSTTQAVLARIVGSHPEPVASHRRAVPANVDAAVRKALEKLPVDRFPTAGAFGSALTDPGFRHGDVPAASRAEVKRWRRAAASATGAAAVTTLLWIGSTLGPGPAEPVDQLVFSLGTGQSLGQFRSFGLAPDGSFLVYQGPGGDGPARLWRRDWQVLEPTLVLAAEGGVSMLPEVSPDQTEVAVLEGGIGRGSVDIVPFDGGVRRRLVVDDAICCPPVWSLDGAWIYFSSPEGIERIPSGTAGDGVREPITRIDSTSTMRIHGQIEFMPGGDKAVFVAWEPLFAKPMMMWVDLASGETGEIRAGQRPRFRDGYLIFAIQEVQGESTTLMAGPFDPEALAFTEEPIPVVDGISKGRYGYLYASISDSGTLVYARGGPTFRSEPVWVDRQGRAEVIDGEWYFGNQFPWFALDLSPRGTRLAASSMRLGTNQDMREYDIWIKELGTGELRTITTTGQNMRPEWFSEDSLTFRRLAAAGASPEVVRADASVSDAAQPIADAYPIGEQPPDLFSGFIAPGSEWLVYQRGLGGTRDVMAVALDGSMPPRALAAGAYHEGAPALSPGGRWLAYESDQTGAREVYVRSFPDGGDVSKISTNGGIQPVWDGLGRELFYRDGSGNMVAVSVTLGDTFSAGAQTVLFDASGYYGGAADPGMRSYDVTPDGQRFVMARQYLAAPEEEMVRIESFLELVRAAFER